MLDLDDDALGLIRSARGGDDPSADERARVLANFRAEREAFDASREATALGSVPLASTPVQRLPPRPRRWALTWSMAALVSLVSAGAFADWHAVARHVRALSEWPQRVLSANGAEAETTPRVTVARGAATGAWTESTVVLNPQPEVPSVAFSTLAPLAQALPKEAASVAPLLAAPAVSPERAAPTPASKLPRSNATAAPLELELALIASARDALARGDFTGALKAARQHARSFAGGALLEERRAIEALAQCRAGRGAELGLAFVQRWPDSLFTPRVKRDCGVSNSVPSESVQGTDKVSDDSSRPRKELTP